MAEKIVKLEDLMKFAPLPPDGSSSEEGKDSEGDEVKDDISNTVDKASEEAPEGETTEKPDSLPGGAEKVPPEEGGEESEEDSEDDTEESDEESEESDLEDKMQTEEEIEDAIKEEVPEDAADAFDQASDRADATDSDTSAREKQNNKDISDEVGSDIGQNLDQESSNDEMGDSGTGNGASLGGSEGENELDKVLEDVVKDFQKDLENAPGEEGQKVGDVSREDLQDAINKEMGGSSLLDLDKIGRLKNVGTKGAWRQQMRRLMEDVLGIRDVYDPASPSRKHEDQFGREIEEPSIDNILVMPDRSGSFQSMALYKPALEALKEFFDVYKSVLNNTTLHVFSWGSHGRNEYKRFRGLSENNFKMIMASPFDGGGTDFGPNLIEAVKMAKRPEMIIVLTDGQLLDQPTPECTAVLGRFRKKLIWVLPKKMAATVPPGITKFDPQARKRSVLYTS